MNKLLNISELSKLLNLTDPITKKPLNHVLRYWEKEFKVIKPKIINKRRYYSTEQIEIIRIIKFLLKNKGLTISGVKKILQSNINKLDYVNNDSLKAKYYRDYFRSKSQNLLERIKKIKKHGKKNSS